MTRHAASAKILRDDDGIPLREGDYITFIFGIPPITVLAILTTKDEDLWIECLSPHDVTPKRERLSSLMKHYQVWKASQGRVAAHHRCFRGE